MLFLAACASPQKPATPPQEPFWTKRAAEPEDPPLLSLATEHTFYLLATDERGTDCRGYKVVQSKQPADDTAFLVEDSYSDAERIGFVNHGARLELVSRTRGAASMACTGTFSVRELDDGDLDVGGARWFARAADCRAALASNARVATDLSACTFAPVANLQQQAASQRRFETILRFGGTVFDDTCAPIRVEAARTNTAIWFEGHFWSELRDGKRRGKSGYGYQLAANAMSISLLGPHSTWSDGSGIGMLCGDDVALAYGIDRVDLASTIYLSAARCRGALAKERARRARLPETSEISAGAPDLGGC